MKTTVSFSLLVMLFLMDNGWHLKIFDPLYTIISLPFQAIVAGICWLILFHVGVYHYIKFKPAYFRWIVLGLLINVVVSYFLGSVIYYDQPIWRVFVAVFWHGGITFYFVLMAFSKVIDPAKIFKTTLIYGFSACLFIVFIYFSGTQESLLSKDCFGERYGQLRIQYIADAALQLLSCYLIAFFLSKQSFQYKFFSKPVLYFLTAILLFQTVIINKTRSYEIGLIITIIMASYFSLKWKFSGLGIRFFSIALTVIVLALPFYFSAIQNTKFVQSLDPQGNEEGSGNVAVRIKDIQFYFGELVKTNFMGFGWVSNKEDSADNAIKEALNKKGFLYVDIGFFGLFCMYGILGLVVTFYFFKKTLGMIKSIIVNGGPQEQMMASSLGAFLIFQLASLTTNQIMYWPEVGFFYALIMFMLDSLQRKTNTRTDMSLKESFD